MDVPRLEPTVSMLHSILRRRIISIIVHNDSFLDLWAPRGGRAMQSGLYVQWHRDVVALLCIGNLRERTRAPSEQPTRSVQTGWLTYFEHEPILEQRRAHEPRREDAGPRRRLHARPKDVDLSSEGGEDRARDGHRAGRMFCRPFDALPSAIRKVICK